MGRRWSPVDYWSVDHPRCLFSILIFQLIMMSTIMMIMSVSNLTVLITEGQNPSFGSTIKYWLLCYCTFAAKVNRCVWINRDQFDRVHKAFVWCATHPVESPQAAPCYSNGFWSRTGYTEVDVNAHLFFFFVPSISVAHSSSSPLDLINPIKLCLTLAKFEGRVALKIRMPG